MSTGGNLLSHHSADPLSSRTNVARIGHSYLNCLFLRIHLLTTKKKNFHRQSYPNEFARGARNNTQQASIAREYPMYKEVVKISRNFMMEVWVSFAKVK